ncbi:MAG TPA: leucyl aminopeptidase [Candidatus Polarisedimenticolia bacterium]|nr:leucyl aminopeptidase [Candidatus Polarisedimenticolia bacterium]
MSGALRFQASQGDLAGLEADVGVVYKYKGEPGIGGPVGTALAEKLAAVSKGDLFDGRAGRHLLWHAPSGDGLRCRRYLILGLGPKDELTLDRYRRYLGEAMIASDRVGAARVAVPLLQEGAAPFAAREAALALVEGILLGTYRFDRYRSERRPGRRHLREVRIAAGDAPARDVSDGLSFGETTASATNFARDLVNEPAGVLTPQRMAEIAAETAGEAKIGFKVIEPEEMRRLGMGGILGVSQGSHNPPRLIHLEYRPEERPVGKIALLGKGLTFDSGGLSLKTADGMETMKCDMAGAATVLAVLRALPELAPRVEVVGLMGMAENMPGGNAIRPGDILKIMNGKTVEVRNTDAEGRLVLADVLSYAATLDGVGTAIDLATLTGAVVVALGPMATGVMGNDQALIDDILRAASKAGESMWPLPLYNEYLEHIRSDVADVKNTGIRWGGAITAALFLQEFVRPGMRWAHLDIAGPAFGEKDYSYIRRGGSGVAVRTLLRYLLDLAA